MQNIPKLNQFINQFTISYFNNSLLVHEYIVRQSGFFDGLLNFYNKSGISYDISHPIDITESLQEIKSNIGEIFSTEMIEDTFIFIMEILYKQHVDLSVYKHDYKYILILFDYFDLPKWCFNKLLEGENLKLWQKYYRIRRSYLPNDATLERIKKIKKIYSSKLSKFGIKEDSISKKISSKYLTTENILSVIRYLFRYNDLFDRVSDIFYDRITYLLDKSEIIDFEGKFILRIAIEIIERDRENDEIEDTEDIQERYYRDQFDR